MSTVTAYNLSLSLVDDSRTCLPKNGSTRKHQQYVLASDYKRELSTKLPSIDVGCQERRLSSLGITGVGQQSRSDKLIYNDNEHTTTKRTCARKRKTFMESHDKKVKDLTLPSIQTKSFKEEKKSKQLCLYSLVEKFRPLNESMLPRQSEKHFTGRRNTESYNTTYNTDALLSQGIERAKLEQKRANKQLESTILRGKGMGNKH